jgi:hypothetical protein
MLLMENLDQAGLIGDLKMSEKIDQVAVYPTLPTEPTDQTMNLSMSKRGDVTYYTLMGDAGEVKNHMRSFGTKALTSFSACFNKSSMQVQRENFPTREGLNSFSGS